ncbi:MAG: lysophospholipid acyltransferase family protein [Paracoccaceae bacterium]
MLVIRDRDRLVNDSNPRYDGRNLSYAGTFSNPIKSNTIRLIELTTGKLTLLKLVRIFENNARRENQSFWNRCLELLNIDINVPKGSIENIPKKGPLIVVANHPHGLVDGLILAELVGRVRTDFKILTRSLLTNVDEIRNHMLPVAFPHEEDALRKNIRMREESMDCLRNNGTIILFPAGRVASSETWMGPAVEPEWSAFTAKLILKSSAQILPVYFPGQNSRVYNWANFISATLRQGLLLHEIVHQMNKAQSPVIGGLIQKDLVDNWRGKSVRDLMAWLRSVTLDLQNGNKHQ